MGRWLVVGSMLLGLASPAGNALGAAVYHTQETLSLYRRTYLKVTGPGEGGGPVTQGGDS